MDDELGGPWVKIAPGDWRILDAGTAWLSMTMRGKDEVIGKVVFDAFPDDPTDPGATGATMLRNSLEKVLATGEKDVMPLVRYDIPRPETMGGGFDIRYWEVSNTPVFDSDGKLLHILHSANDVTQGQVNSDMAIRTLMNGERIDGWERSLRKARTEARVLYAVVLALFIAGAFAVGELRSIADSNRNLIRDGIKADLARCAVTSAVIDSGRAIIESGAETLPKEFEKNLVKLGFPPMDVRLKRARESADAYSDSIQKRVREVTGEPLAVLKNGKLDCAKLVPRTGR